MLISNRIFNSHIVYIYITKIQIMIFSYVFNKLLEIEFFELCLYLCLYLYLFICVFVLLIPL